ncbi:hypothetical protein BDY21DRAFT_369452 [Lineolata rhizophorae]|uniref:Uncharacterized protein n=1 Tax=Lineolata rhizophorae TaxID=578093 RepID=A0A6A6P912_9PEZI|nr:hypothetical protein BDY21DRAFT_369452 [Lineolata rhizophorae]
MSSMQTASYGGATGAGYQSDSDDGQATGGRKAVSALPKPPTSANLAQPAGSLLKGATDDKGNLKDAALMLGIKLDLEAEVHLTARVRGDIVIGLY